MKKVFLKWSFIATTFASSFSNIFCCGKKDIKDIKDIKEEELIEILHAYFTKRKTGGTKDNITEKSVKNMLGLAVDLFNSNIKKEFLENENKILFAQSLYRFIMDKITASMNPGSK